MRKFFVLFLAVVFLATALFQWDSDGLQALDKSGCEMDCQKCHTITNQEAKEILQNMKIPGGAEVLKVQLSPVKGLWEVSFLNNGKPAVMYVDFSKSFILPGPVVEIKGGKNKTQERLAKLQESRRVDFSKIPLNQGLVMGDVLAPQKVAVFTDPDCNFCEKLHKEMKKVLQERKDIVFYILLYPLSIHKDAYWKSKSIFCNRSLQMLENAYDRKEILRLECDTKEIDANIRIAEALGITGTPTLVLPDGRTHTGAMPANQLIDFIQRNR
ncbi:MAG TPA: DsbC family protein [Thermodesulfobacteriota bacterium]|nr:DsbC family protein [Thermodesulfobacteriota bacterium]